MDRRLLALCAAPLAAAVLGACGGDEAPPTFTGSPGARVFAESGCGGCHAFRPAGTTGTAGPSLDGSSVTAAAAAAIIRKGAGTMPAYADGLSKAEILAVADFVTSR